MLSTIYSTIYRRYLVKKHYFFRYDVANLNCLFALPESSYIHTVSKHCRAALVHGFIRKTAKGAIYVQKMTPNEQHIAEKKLNSLIEIEKSKAKEVEETVNITNGDKSQQISPTRTLKDSVKKKKIKKSKKAKESDRQTSSTSTVQLINVSSSDIIEFIPGDDNDSEKSKSEIKIKKKHKKVAKIKTSENDSKTEELGTSTQKQTKLSKKKKAKKRKSEVQLKESDAKRPRN